jgi:HK97 family phage major capsid protein
MAANETLEDLTLLQQLRAKRSDEINALSALIESRQEQRNTFDEREKSDDKPDDEARSGFAASEAAFVADFDQREAAIKELDRRIAEQEIIERRREEAAAASGGETRVVSEPKIYRRDNAEKISYFRDLCMSDPKIAQSMRSDPAEALERLHDHAKDVGEWTAKRSAEREKRANEQIDRAEREFHRSRGLRARGFDASPFERRVNPNRTSGQGGYFVPPLWLIDEYIPALRAGRIAAGLCRQMDLPEGTDSINIPKLSTTTKVGVQGADAAPVTSQDITDTAVTANVKTLAGQEDIAIQLLEQSPGQIIDQVITEDLFADYNRLVDQQVLYGNGTNSASLNGGQILGIYPSTNWTTNTVTWTTSAQFGPGFNMVLGAMASKTAYNRYNLENFHFLLHPRRWFWFATALDGASGTVGRPVVNIESVAYNVSALEVPDVPFEGLAGRVPFGPAAYIDGNVPVTDNGSGVLSGTYDLAIGAKWDDLWLFEGDLRTRVLPEVLSGTLEVRFQLYNYVAFLVRYGQSITLAQGSGFGAPASAIDSSVTF